MVYVNPAQVVYLRPHLREAEANASEPQTVVYLTGDLRSLIVEGAVAMVASRLAP